jgi:hypothetical protein
MSYSGAFEPLNEDDRAPQTPKLTHQHIDNYGVYTIVCLDKVRTGKVAERHYQYSSTNGVTFTGETIHQIENYDNPDNIRSDWMDSFLAYQAVGISEIPVDFGELIAITTPVELPTELYW